LRGIDKQALAGELIEDVVGVEMIVETRAEGERLACEARGGVGIVRIGDGELGVVKERQAVEGIEVEKVFSRQGAEAQSRRAANWDEHR